MRLNRAVYLLSIFAALLALSCGSEPVQDVAQPAEKKVVSLSTGQPCLARMSNSATRWRADALPVRLTSEANSESNGQDGTSSVWRATFVSLSARQAKNYACSGSLLRESPARGVTSTMEFASSDHPFAVADFRVDSDAAAKLSNDNGGAKLLKANPQQPVFFELAVNPHAQKLVWAVVYGTSGTKNEGIGLVDASTPRFIGAATKK